MDRDDMKGAVECLILIGIGIGIFAVLFFAAIGYGVYLLWS